MKRHRRASEDVNISFLDIICCGFGAIVLLLVIIKPSNLPVLEETNVNLEGQVRQLQERLFAIRGQVEYLETELNAKHEQLGKTNALVAILRSKRDEINAQIAALEKNPGDAAKLVDLERALQELSVEMRRLLKQRKIDDNQIAGIPVDSEYVVFIIDGSQSMRSNSWGRMLLEVSNILKIYPNVKGVQVLSGEGYYLFPETRKKWLRDTPPMRRKIISKLTTWGAQVSSPVGGIRTAIEHFYDSNKKISLYVFGDHHQGGATSRILRIVNRMNPRDHRGESMVRIHAVGFPYLLESSNTGGMSLRFAHLMRELTQDNNGSFVGLESHF